MLNDYEKKLIENISEHGWFCMSVFGDEDSIPFAYSIGFWETLHCPDLIIFGLDNKFMHSMLWDAFRQIKSGANEVRDHNRWSGLIDRFDCISRPVHPTRIRKEHFNSAMWYRRHKAGPDATLSAYQLFWPSATTGLFPWEKGCEEEIRKWQPLLYLPDSVG